MLFIVAIDPGQTIGFATLQYEIGAAGPELISTWEVTSGDFPAYLQRGLQYYSVHSPVVVVEDYRVFADKAMTHVGQRLHTSEIIGMIIALCSISEPKIEVIRVDPAKKGRWGPARMEHKFPAGLVATGHGMSALQVGLCYLEATKLWKP